MKNFQRFMSEMATAAAPEAPGKNIGEDYGKLKREIATTVTQLESLMQKYEERVNQLHTLLGQKGAAMRSHLAGKQSEIDTLRTTIATMTQEVATLRQTHQTAITEAKSKIAELEAKVADLGVDKHHLDARVRGATEDIAESARKVADWMEKYEALKKQWEAESSQHSDTWARANRLQGDLDRERGDHAVTKAQLAGKQGESDSAVQAAQELAQFLEELNQNLSQENETLKSNIQSLEKEVDRLAGGDAFSPSDRKKQLKVKHGDGQGLTGLSPDLAHTKNGGFNLKEHLERAAKSQGVKRSWF